MWRTALASQEKQPLETTLVFLSAEALMSSYGPFPHFFTLLLRSFVTCNLISRPYIKVCDGREPLILKLVKSMLQKEKIQNSKFCIIQSKQMYIYIYINVYIYNDTYACICPKYLTFLISFKIFK